MPKRLCYGNKSEFKKINKKRNKFRKQIREKYLIKESRLFIRYYKYKYNNDKIFELKIPFANEKNSN